MDGSEDDKKGPQQDSTKEANFHIVVFYQDGKRRSIEALVEKNITVLARDYLTRARFIYRYVNKG